MLSIIEAILGSHWIVEQPSVHVTMSFHKKSDKRLELWKINQRIDRSEKSLKYILIVEGLLKSLHCFPLDVDVNEIISYLLNCLLHECRKNAITNK